MLHVYRCCHQPDLALCLSLMPFVARIGHVPAGCHLFDKALLQLAADMQGAGVAANDKLLLLRGAGRALSLPHVLPREYSSTAVSNNTTTNYVPSTVRSAPNQKETNHATVGNSCGFRVASAKVGLLAPNKREHEPISKAYIL